MKKEAFSSQLSALSQKITAGGFIFAVLVAPSFIAEEAGGCGQSLPIAEAALTLTQIGCVMSSTLTDAQALADFCKIAGPAIPAIQNLIGEREAAKKSGVSWPGADAGADASAR